jgi:hypothetical protein
MRRFSPILLTLLLSWLLFQPNLLGGVQAQQDDRTLRVLIEGDRALVQAALDKLQVAAFDRGFKIVIVTQPADPHDIRLILTAASGTVSDTNPGIPYDAPQFPVAFGYASAVALTPGGNVLFTLAASGYTVRAATIAVANQVAARLVDSYGTLKRGLLGPDIEATQTTAAGVQPAVPENGSSEVPPEFGVYYREAGTWIRIAGVEPAQTNSNGMARALLSWGLAGINVLQVYQGSKAPVQISSERPTFYVRGLAPSAAEVMLLRFDEKRDSRELRIARVSPFSTQAGPRIQDLTGAIVTRIGNDVVTITPRSELKPGEYLLRIASPELSSVGYDFGISVRKK